MRWKALLFLGLAILTSGCLSQTQNIQLEEMNYNQTYSIQGSNDPGQLKEAVKASLDQTELNYELGRIYQEGNKSYFTVFTEENSTQDIVNGFEPGNFSAKFNLTISEEPGLSLEKNYSVNIRNQTVEIGNKTIEEGESISLESREIELLQISNGTIELLVEAYGTEDILDTGDISVGGSQVKTYRFDIVLTDEAAQNFYEVAQNYEIGVDATGRSRLVQLSGEPAELNLYLNENKTGSPSLGPTYRERPIQTQRIVGAAYNKEMARNEADKIKDAITSSVINSRPKLVSSGRILN